MREALENLQQGAGQTEAARNTEQEDQQAQAENQQQQEQQQQQAGQQPATPEAGQIDPRQQRIEQFLAELIERDQINQERLREIRSRMMRTETPKVEKDW